MVAGIAGLVSGVVVVEILGEGIEQHLAALKLVEDEVFDGHGFSPGVGGSGSIIGSRISNSILVFRTARRSISIAVVQQRGTTEFHSDIFLHDKSRKKAKKATAET